MSECFAQTSHLTLELFIYFTFHFKMKKQIKLMADYNCWPLWEYEDNDLVDNLYPSKLSLSYEVVYFSEIQRRVLSSFDEVVFLAR